jgi:GT2 family glycosyltransferase
MTATAAAPDPGILVIIVTWNKKQYLLDLLDSLADLEHASYRIDILVVDNASDDGTREAIRAKHPKVRLIHNQDNLGGTGGFNTGLRWAFEQPSGRYQYLWLLDNDVLVHRNALVELVALLESHPDIAVAGSTMMQLDYPWRINEMGAFIDRSSGKMIFNRHLESIPSWQGCSVQELLSTEVDLSGALPRCPPYMDVEYVAAASLLIRSETARQAGLWRDYFIHFDDVEWCFRIADLGHRIVVSARSLIWHLSAAAKVRTWVLYYDNRNVLDLLRAHGYDTAPLAWYILKKALYYHLIGKPDLAQLHYDAVADFDAGRLGKKDIRLPLSNYQSNDELMSVLLDPAIHRILLAWTADLDTTPLQHYLTQARARRPELDLHVLTRPGGKPELQLPQLHFLFTRQNIWRWITYWQLRGCYDLVIQSDRQPLIGLSMIDADLLYIDGHSFCRYPSPGLSGLWRAGLQWIFRAILHKSRWVMPQKQISARRR